MKEFRLVLLVVFFASSLLVATAAEAKSVDEQKWIIVKTDNFAIHSALSKKDTKDLLMHLEALRSMFLILGTKSETLVEKPTNIFVFARPSDYHALGFPKDSAGIFLSDLRQNFIAIMGSDYTQESPIVMHEYAHFIMQANSRFPFPKWWIEGEADYVAGSRLLKRHLVLGTGLAGRFYTLRHRQWMPWEKIIDASNYAEYSSAQENLFYAQSWLLVHYLRNRGSEERSTTEAWSIYSAQLKNGADKISAFQNSFELTLNELDVSMRRYAKRWTLPTIKIPTEALLPSFNPSVARIRKSDIQASLGQIALRLRDAEQAKSWFGKSLKIEPNNSTALSGLAISHMAARQYDEAEELFARAIGSNANDPVALVEYAKFILFQVSGDDTRLAADESFGKAETLLLAARDIAGTTVEIDTYLAMTRLGQQKNLGDIVELLESIVVRSPSDDMPALMLAGAYAEQGLNDLAVASAEMLIRSAHSENPSTAAARLLITEIREENESSGESGPNTTVPATPPQD